MFGIGFSELVLVCLVLIIFIRPADLPKFLRSAGKFYGKARKFYRELVQVKDKVLKEIDEAASLDMEPAAPPKAAPKVLSAPAEKAAAASAETVPAASAAVPQPEKTSPGADSSPSLTVPPKSDNFL